MGCRRGASLDRGPHRRAARTRPPRPHLLPAAHHRGGRAAAADRAVQDRRRTPAAGQPRTRRRAGHRAAPDPGRRRRGPAGGALRRLRVRLVGPGAAAVPTSRGQRAPGDDHVRPAPDARRHLARTGLVDPATGGPLHFTPHDFRRMFRTDAIASGLPPHIAQVIAGHRDLNVTLGYKAVYPTEAIQAHRAFLARRRALRPSEEYRTPTDGEWQEFLGHFERRQVSTGTCARAFATPCLHEHACICCPVLRPDPHQRPRLVEISDNLLARIAEAEREGWPGEAEGLRVSLAGAQDKLSQLDRRPPAGGPVGLGTPRRRGVDPVVSPPDPSQHQTRSGTYLALWPVDPDASWPAAHAAALDDLTRLTALAGVVLVGPPTFTCCEPPGWSGPLGTPGDLLLVAVAAVRAAAADERTSAPTGSPTAQYLPADVTVRERGVGERAARLEALTRLLRTGLTTEAIAVRTGLSTRTLDRLRVAVDNPSP